VSMCHPYEEVDGIVTSWLMFHPFGLGVFNFFHT
jgi:hypothetical protein